MPLTLSKCEDIMESLSIPLERKPFEKNKGIEEILP